MEKHLLSITEKPIVPTLFYNVCAAAEEWNNGFPYLSLQGTKSYTCLSLVKNKKGECHVR
jgi:hypothetical protein